MTAITFDPKIVLPSIPCQLEGYDFKCPAHPWEYLAKEHEADAKTPDRTWNAYLKQYVQTMF
jgi:hypothetical protein